jgi:N-acetylmuramoyl-L-alanine amidase
MATSALLTRLATIYQGEEVRHPQLRAVTLAQWMLESGRGTSKLAKEHYNFGGLKWRREMAAFATKVRYEAHDGADDYCKFATMENFIRGYWAFLDRAPYTGWEEHVETGEDFIRFIGPVYTPSKNYADRVLALVPEAEALLAEPLPTLRAMAAESSTDLGAVVIDPGHGGTQNMPGSSANNAISASGVKEKKLTLDFCLILRDELLKQAAKANEQIKIVLTRTTDINLPGRERAAKAFEHKAKLFLCLHFNGSDKPAVRGTETFYRAAENGNLNLAADIAFATDIQNALFETMAALDPGAKDRGTKPDTKTGPGALGVLNDKALGNDRRRDMCKSAYIEAEFITNRAVNRLLVAGDDVIANRTKLMAAVAKVLRAHMK